MPDDIAMPRPPGMQRAGWYLNRLRCMTAAEIPHRVARAIVTRLQARGMQRRRVPRANTAQAGCVFIELPADIQATPYLSAADAISDGRLDVFAMPAAELGNPPRWNRDPKTGTDAPLTFGKTLNYRDPATVGDIKYLWEPNRHMHLVTLAQAWRLNGEARYLETLAQHLDSWLRQCPPGLGPNWASALEAGMRLVNWSLAWQLLGGLDSPLFQADAGRQLRHRWLQSVYQHARFVNGYYSRHSSANNHLIGEATGVHIAALTWPYWPRMQRWGRRARSIVEREAQAQNAPDGVNREQAFAYQQFEVDLLLLNSLAATASGRPLGECFTQRLEAMVSFLAAVMDCGGNVPMVGDSDDGFAVRLSQESSFCPYRSLFATAAVLFGRGDLKASAGGMDDKTRWLLGERAERSWQRLPVPRSAAPRQRAFPDGGYYLLGSAFGSDREIRLLADAGPLGYREIAAHGHADALAFTLSVAGKEFLIDPGTFAYHADDGWRQYFRGTAAHNTVRIDGQSQSQPGGNFMWLKKAAAHCHEWRAGEHEDLFEGSHDGYLRLPDPVTHRRRIRLDKRQREITVDDYLGMRQEHRVEMLFHCDERCTIETGADSVTLERDGRRVKLSVPLAAGGVLRVYRGSESPRFGWVSRRFDERRPCNTVVWHATLAEDTRLTTRLQC